MKISTSISRAFQLSVQNRLDFINGAITTFRTNTTVANRDKDYAAALEVMEFLQDELVGIESTLIEEQKFYKTAWENKLAGEEA